MSYLRSLNLSNFRCYSSARLDGLSGGLIVLYGANGAGKTNVLEAVSLLSPGRGLRGAKVMEVQSNDSGDAWGVAGELATDYGPIKLGTGLDVATEKRVIRVNGQNVRGQSALAEHISCVWLTPQMDRLFLDSASHRRRFLDRLVFAFDPGHSGRVTRYENAMRQRSRVLQDGGDMAWVEGLESQMAETGCAIAAARLDFVGRLQVACEGASNEHFPLAKLQARGVVEEVLLKASALEAEEIFANQLKESRSRDAITGGALIGPHKSDLNVVFLGVPGAEKNMAADQCSTGEQKALLIGIILAHAALIKAERGSPPILLLDEVAAHLDEVRRAALYDLLGGLGGQVWLTGTDANLFTAVEGRAQFFEVADAAVNPLKNRSAA